MNGNRVFVGRRMQRGYGLASFFASLYRRALPLIKSGSQYLAKKAVKTGINTLQDISMGANPRQALKRRLTESSEELLDTVKAKLRRKMQPQQRGKGIQRKRRRALKKKRRQTLKKRSKHKNSKKMLRGTKNIKKLKKKGKKKVRKPGRSANDIFKI